MKGKFDSRCTLGTRKLIETRRTELGKIGRVRCTAPHARIASLGAKMIKIAGLSGVLLCASAAHAQTDCRTIRDTAAAIACLDKSLTSKAAKPKSAKPKAAAKLVVDPMAHVKDAVLKTLKDPAISSVR
jgi:hypothetical protein